MKHDRIDAIYNCINSSQKNQYNLPFLKTGYFVGINKSPKKIGCACVINTD